MAVHGGALSRVKDGKLKHSFILVFTKSHHLSNTLDPIKVMHRGLNTDMRIVVKFSGGGGTHATEPYADNPPSMYVYTQQCNLPPTCSLMRVRPMLNYKCSSPNLS